ncbi:protein FAM83G isoform X2 [Engraulis encrasicolus]|uniref:protein FAM83G isoform X2 n=1 Tax=Engraulis encrasicolus TaxID=184585 RepID=UPI002FD0C843
MALSQIQCLDDGSINCRITESKPEFLYSEDHRLALEILFHDGREAYEKYLTAQNVRGFLSDHELDHLTQTVVLYNPGGHGETVANGEGEDGKVASEYWPERSDHSYSELDLGWPDISSYRGVTRVTVHTQPPMDGQPHIKEVVRRIISQAQKVIAVVMDMFTDVDIFRDLLDMSYRRRVAIYIVLEATGVSHFLHMCDRAGMHKGHLKRLRVSCMRGTEFLTHSSKKVCGAINHNFMFVDGDKTVSGSYSFTWSSSRLDRNVITLLTGQAVETFDRLFRDLYFSSRAVSLANVTLVEEPEVEPVTYTAQQAAAAAALARKAYSAKYALLSNSSMKSGGTCSSKNTSGHLNPLPIFLRQVRLLAEEPRIHPGLVGLEKANMMHYLPTWPEPDPPSDVIGIINVRDTSKPFQAHLMRSELFETSQAIRFKEPFHVPAEPLPEKATPRPRTELGQPLKTKGC